MYDKYTSNIKLLCISALYWQMQMRLMEMKDLENHNDQSDWRDSPQSILVNGATDYCSLSTSSSETANLNEHAEGQNNLESEPIHQESSVSLYSVVLIISVCSPLLSQRERETETDEDQSLCEYTYAHV